MRLFEISDYDEAAGYTIESYDADTIRFTIQNECQPWLQETQGKHVYRGINLDRLGGHGSVPAFQQLKCPKFRRPMTIHPKFQEMIDYAFDDNGFIAKRENSIFGTGNQAIAITYGYPFIMYPIGEYSYSWSPTIEDLFFNDMDITIKCLDVYDFFNAYGQDTNFDISIFKKLFPNLHIKSYAEGILVASESAPNPENIQIYYDILAKVNKAHKITGRFIDLNKLDKYIASNYHKDGLAEAIDTGHEIMVHCDSYYVIPASIYLDIFSS